MSAVKSNVSDVVARAASELPAPIEARALAAGGAPRRANIVTRGLDALLFIATLIVSMALVAGALLLVPFVVMISSVADLFGQGDALTAWTDERPRAIKANG
ncbi:MAG: hypothetical protein AAFY22_07720 [Pseudomonadota bacterium]